MRKITMVAAWLVILSGLVSSPAMSNQAYADLQPDSQLYASAYDQVVETFNAVDASWDAWFVEQGYDATTPRLVVVGAGETFSADCGNAYAEGEIPNAFYCPTDRTVVITMADVLYHTLGGSNTSSPTYNGNLALAEMVAHEYGHSVYCRVLGFDACAYPQLPLVELAADCLAGVGANKTAVELDLGTVDFEAVEEMYFTILTTEAQYVAYRGTTAQRVEAFWTGWAKADPQSCWDAY